MDIATVMDKLRGYEAAITVTPNPITGIGSLATRRAYLYLPDRQDALPEVDPVGFFNAWHFNYLRRMPNAQRETSYTITTQCLVREPALNDASRIASAFHTAFLAAVDAHVSFEGAATLQTVRDGDLLKLEWGGLAFIGWTTRLEVIMRDSTTVGA